MRSRIFFAPLFGLVLSTSASADILVNWDDQFSILNQSVQFNATAIDDLGNVYAVGQSHNGVDLDAVIVKYGPGGGVHWSKKFTGAGAQVGRCVAVTPAGNYLFFGYDSQGTKPKFLRLNPANGSLHWEYVEGNFNNYPAQAKDIVIDDSAPDTVHFISEFVPPVNPSIAVGETRDFFNNDLGGYGMGLIGNNYRIFKVAKRPQGGYYLLYGIPAVTNPLTTLRFVDQTGTPGASLSTSLATSFACSSVKGGVGYAVGRSSSNGLGIYKINTTTHAIIGTASDTFSGLTDLRIHDVAVGANGECIAAGFEEVPFKSSEWFIAAYGHQSLSRLWRNVRPGTSNQDFYRKIVADPFGSVAALGVRAGATDQITVQVYDVISGTRLGQALATAPSGETNLFGLAANSKGHFSGVGVLQDMGFTTGQVWSVFQNGVRRLSTPLNAYTGGATVPLTISMYAAKNVNRSIALTSNQAVFPVPANTTLNANAISKTINVLTLQTGVDRTVTVTASLQGSVRTHTVIIKKP